MKFVSAAILVAFSCATVAIDSDKADWLAKFSYDLKVNCYTETIGKTITTILDSIVAKRNERFDKVMRDSVVLLNMSRKAHYLQTEWNSSNDELKQLNAKCIHCIIESDAEERPKCLTLYEKSTSQVFHSFGNYYLKQEHPDLYAKIVGNLAGKCNNHKIDSFFA